jgi:single-strand DNA-binding protein
LFNRVILVGRLVADPEVRYTPDGIPIASFRLAVDRPTRRGMERQTDFIRIVTFRRLAEFVQSYLTKGRLVLVEGRLQVNSYTDRMGQRRTAVDVVAFNVQFMDRKPEGVTPAAPSVASGAGFPSSLEPMDILPEQDVPIDDIVLDELPPPEEEGNEFPF